MKLRANSVDGKKTNKPLKRFGQNYIRDKNVLLKIINEFNPRPEDKIIEIGPGRGALTKLLLEKVNNLTVVEIDTRVIKTLQKLSPNINIVNDDFLIIDLNSFYTDDNKKIRVIGNIPYNITSPIMFKLRSEEHTSELQSHSFISYAVFCLKKKKLPL